jgi:shikimate dehydrogenase
MKNAGESRASDDRLRKKVLLLGREISKSISPAIHRKAFEATGFEADYQLLDLEDFEFQTGIDKIRASSETIGFNVTIPYKEKILPYLQELDGQSKAIGAVNTVKFDAQRKMSGFNTDVDGIVASFARLDLSGAQSMTILGAGGAARACIYSAATSGFTRIAILNRTEKRSRALANEFCGKFPGLEILSSALSRQRFDQLIGQGCDLLINTIPPSGVLPFAGLEAAPRSMKYFELSYRGGSPLLKAARARGLEATNGLVMLVEQAAKSFEIWTGMTAPRQAMMLEAESQVSIHESSE